MKRILVSGSLAYDRIMDFPGLFKDHFLPDALHSINVSFLVQPPTVNFGGCAGNIAYGLSLLGIPADILENAGNDFERYRERLKKLTIGTELIAVHTNLPTASAYIITDKEDNQIAAFAEGASGAAYPKSLTLAPYAWAIVGTASIATSMEVIRAAKTASLPYLFDPSQKLTAFSKEELIECLTGARGVVVNDYELRMIGETTGWKEEEILEAAQFLIVTLGADGSRIRTTEGEEYVPALAVSSIVDPTGAGDAYRAGLIAGLAGSLPLSTCAKLGSAVAAHAVECYGTQNYRFTHQELADRYRDAYKDPLPF